MWVRSGGDGYLRPVQFLDHLTVIITMRKSGTFPRTDNEDEEPNLHHHKRQSGHHQASFAVQTMRIEAASSHLACTALCDYWAEREASCNSYSYKGLFGFGKILMICLGQVTFDHIAILV